MSVKVKKRSGQSEMSNLFRENSEITALFRHKLAEKNFWQKVYQQAAQLSGFPSISAITLAFLSLL